MIKFSQIKNKTMSKIRIKNGKYRNGYRKTKKGNR